MEDVLFDFKTSSVLIIRVSNLLCKVSTLILKLPNLT